MFGQRISSRFGRRSSARILMEALESRTLLTASVVNSFAGKGLNGWIPPDTMGAVGPAHVVDLINDYFQVHDKSTGSALLSKTGDQFWADAGVSGLSAFDQRIIFDTITQRWFAITDSNAGVANNSLGVAVSATADPTGLWKGIAFSSAPGTSNWADYPTFGLDANGIYIGANMFSTAGSYQGAKLWAIPKADLLWTGTGAPTGAHVNTFNLSPAGTLMPVHDLNASKAATGPAYVINRSGSGINLRTVTWSGTVATLSSASTIGISGASSGPVNGTQPGTGTQYLDALDGRINNALITNGSSSLWTLLSTTIGGRAGAVWAQINLNTRTVTQSGNLADANADILFPSIAANDAGDAMIGFTKVGGTTLAPIYPSVWATGRLGTDAAGTLQKQVQIKAGSAWYTDNGGAGTNARFGDYSITWVDPSDTTKFWTYQEYAPSASAYNFGTWWGQLSLANPPAAPTNFAANGASSTSIALTWSDVADNESGYRIERSTDGGQNYSPVTTTAPNATTFTDTGLSANTSYTYRLTALNNYGSAAVTTTGTTQQATVPTAPSNLALTIASATQINLTWVDKSTNETGFKIFRSVDGTNFGLLTTVGAGVTTYQNTGLTPGGSYWYYVVATNGVGDSGASNTASATTPFAVAPNAPTNLNATAPARSRITLTWADNATNETGFRVERSTNGTTWSQVASLGANVTSWTDTSVKRNTFYYYRVYAYNSYGNSAYSNVATITSLRKPEAYAPELDPPAYIGDLNYSFTLVALPTV